MQTIAIYRAQKSDPQGNEGMEGYTTRVYPMDWQITNLLRPKRAMDIG